MRLLGIDYGEKRIGLAYADEVGVALPLGAATAPRWEERMARIRAEIEARKIERLIVGYPLNMDGSAGFKAQEVDHFIERLEERFGLPVERVDERLSSQAASQSIRKGGRSVKRRLKERRSGELDSRAAAIILQDWLDSQGCEANIEPV